MQRRLSSYTIPPDVQRLWLRSLHREWDAVNRSRLGGRLRPPQILIDDSQTHDGAWNARSRCLSLSLNHILRSVWVEVALTLRHEMAHQVVDELLGSRGERPHGMLFREACAMLDLELSPRLSADPPPEERRILERIRKLMNLAQSPYPEEAQAAMAAANRLLLRHNLRLNDAEQTPRYSIRWLGEPVGRIPLERKLLSCILQDFFFVRCIWIATEEMSTGRSVSLLEIMGRGHNLDIAEYVHDYLLKTLDRLWKEYQGEHARMAAPRAYRNDFRVGALQGFRQHLEVEQQASREMGLVWLGDARLKSLFEERHPERRRCGGGSYHIGSAHADGQQAGLAIRIRSGIGEPRSAASRGSDTPRLLDGGHS